MVEISRGFERSTFEIHTKSRGILVIWSIFFGEEVFKEI
jgi:hypothetical protein